jgi:hypothetical protein
MIVAMAMTACDAPRFSAIFATQIAALIESLK